MTFSTFPRCYAFLVLLLFNTVIGLPPPSQVIAERSSSGPLVFAHYMLIEQPKNNDYTNDIKLAKEVGIDAFAVNFGGWNANFDQQAGYLAKFYAQASDLDFKLFLSFDLTSVTSCAMIVNITNTYSTHPAQLLIDSKPLLSTFQTGDPPWNWHTDVLNHLSPAPLFIPSTLSRDSSQAYQTTAAYADGLFPWIHTDASTTEESLLDTSFASSRTAAAKKWIAPVAPWFFKRFGADMNWANKQDDGIWIPKWLHLLELKPDFIEIVTWNDWGESSYIGPANWAAEGEDQGCYWSHYDHSAFLKMTRIFAKAFHAGETSVTVDKADEDVFMFYRTQPAMTNGVDDTLRLPDNAEFLHDNVFVVSFLHESATITLRSGSNEPVSFVAPPGVSTKALGWSLGEQRLTAGRQGDETFKVDKTGLPVSGQFREYNGNVVAV